MTRRGILAVTLELLLRRRAPHQMDQRDHYRSLTYAPHKLSMEIVRLANGLVEVAAFVDNNEYLRDAIKTTDTGYNVLQPIPFSYDYVAFRNAANDWDYVIDNFKVETFAAGVLGDFNSSGKVDAGDYATWRKNNGTNTRWPMTTAWERPSCIAQLQPVASQFRQSAPEAGLRSAVTRCRNQALFGCC